MNKYYWITLLLFSINIQASDIATENAQASLKTETSKSNIQKKAESFLTFLGACGLGCTSGALCATFFTNPRDELLLNVAVSTIIWKAWERQFMNYLCSRLKELNISHDETLLIYAEEIASYLSWRSF